MNKVVCYSRENVSKRNERPTNGRGAMKAFGRHSKSKLWTCFVSSKEYPHRYNKFKQLVAEELDESFKGSQLSDTAYASTKAREFLERVCKEVKVIPGKATARLRGIWGLNSILYEIDGSAKIHQKEGEVEDEFKRRKGEEQAKKNRSDHRHHAIDAIVLAFTEQRHVKRLSEEHRNETETERIGWPIENFRQQCREAVEKILISHKKPRNKRYVISKGEARVEKSGAIYHTKRISVRGQLHKDTVYSQHGSSYHVRKPLGDIKTRKQVEKIVDSRVRSLVHGAVLDAGGYDSNGNVPKDAFFEIRKDAEGKDLNEPKVCLPNKNGDDVPVRKVRMREEIGNAAQLKRGINQHVNPSEQPPRHRL